MMRQAGRYLPEYRALRERVDFLTLCKSPRLAVQASLQPVERFGVDACIIFSDILIPVEAMGLPLSFTDAGPRLALPVRDGAGVDRLRAADPYATMSFVLEALALAGERLRGAAALVGFVGGPFTLASYIIEGGGSKNFAATKTLMYAQPRVFHALLAKLTDTLAAFAAAQVAAGAQAIQVFDTWAGELEPHAFERFALPYQAAVIERIKSSAVPAILFVNGCAGKLALLAQSGADVLSLDWRLDLGAARRQLGDDVTLQGNVDPCVLLSTPEAAGEAARRAMGTAAGSHILNLGHGVLPATPLECVRAFVEAARSSAAQSALI
jgi:uroporphyrinogen decarboxylase